MPQRQSHPASRPPPLYQQVASQLEREIASQGWGAHHKLPSELDLAEEFGVSRGTVTKALDSLVRLGILYRKQPQGTFVAQSRASSSPSAVAAPPALIGVIGRGFSDEPRYHVDGSFLMGAQSMARTAGYGVVVGCSEDDAALERYQLEHLPAIGAAGLVIFTGPHPVKREGTALISQDNEERIEGLRRLQEQGIPFVLVDRYVPEIASDYVTSDDVAAGELATTHLLSMGYRRICFIATPFSTSVMHRFDGYARALAAYSLPVADRLVLHVEHEFNLTFTDPALPARLRRCFSGNERPDAVVVVNDDVGLQVLAVAEDLGLRVPEDLAVASCGWGGRVSATARVPLTSIVQPLNEIGRQAVHVLLDSINGRASSPRRVVLPVSLAVRQSSGAAARKPMSLSALPPASA